MIPLHIRRIYKYLLTDKLDITNAILTCNIIETLCSHDITQKYIATEVKYFLETYRNDLTFRYY